MSSLSDIQWKVNEQRRLNSELTSELNAITNGISNAYNRWERLCGNVSSSLNNGAQRVAESQRNIEAAYELQGEIDKMYVLFKNIETANKKIRECNNKKIYDFANYSAVRKIVSAMLDNLEVSLVSDQAITKVVEIKHLQLPDYWLTCALLSIMAWRNNDKALAQQALERACKLDKKESAVFFLAFNLRMGRESAALKWFEYYQTCDLTGEDDRTFLLLFSIVNQAVKENCSDEVVSKVSAYIKRVIKDDMSKSGFSEDDMIARIRHYLNRFIPNDTIGYTLLTKHCIDRDTLHDQMMLAKANISILDFILKTVNITDKERRDYLNSFIEDTVKKPNKVELDVDDEIQYNELIIRHQGDIDVAKEEFDQIKTHRENDFDIVLEMIDWIYNSKQDVEVNPMVKANMFNTTKDLHRKSIAAYIESYRAKFKTTYDIKINDYETTANLTDEGSECSKLRTFIENKKASMLSTVKMWPAFIGLGIAVLSVVGVIALSAPALLVFTVAGVAFAGVHTLSSNSKKKRISRDCENEYLIDEGVLKGMVSDFSSYVKEYNEYDSYAEKIEEEFEKL